MIVRAEDFIAQPHPVLNEPGLPDEMKRHFKELGLTDTLNRVECLDIVDDCFFCGKKLSTPYVYWNGGTGSLSLHAKCSAKLALGLAQDASAVSTGHRPDSETTAVQWLDLFAQKKEYGVEDEEFPVS